MKSRELKLLLFYDVFCRCFSAATDAFAMKPAEILVLPTPVWLDGVISDVIGLPSTFLWFRLSTRTTRRDQPTSHRAGHTSC